MNERIRQGILVVVLIVACIWGYQNLFGDKRKGAVNPPIPAAPARALIDMPQTSPAPSPDTSAGIPNVDELRRKAWGSDPFRRQAQLTTSGPGGKTAPNRPEWYLSGIFFSDHGPIALINDKLVKVGETVDRAEVVDINRKQVTLRIGGKDRVLTLPNG